MKPIDLDDITDEVFLADIDDLTKNIPKEFPTWLLQIEQTTGAKPCHIRFTDFVENVDNETSDEEFAGYFYDIFAKQMYQYSATNDILSITAVDKERLTVRDTFSLKVLHLLT